MLRNVFKISSYDWHCFKSISYDTDTLLNNETKIDIALDQPGHSPFCTSTFK